MTNRVNASVTGAGSEVSGSGETAEVWTPDTRVQVLTYRDDDGHPYTVVDVRAGETAVVLVNDIDIYREGMFV